MNEAKTIVLTGIVNTIVLDNEREKPVVTYHVTTIKQNKVVNIPISSFRTERVNVVKNDAYQFTVKVAVKGVTEYLDANGEPKPHKGDGYYVDDFNSVIGANKELTMMQLQAAMNVSSAKPVEEEA